MSWLQFGASVVQSLAWPAAAVLAALILKRPIAVVLQGPVRRWKAGPAGLEVEYWDHQTQEVRRELEQTASNLPTAEWTGESLPREDSAVLAALSPAAAVMESFIGIERELDGLLRYAGVEVQGPLSARAMARHAESHGLIGPEARQAIEDLAGLRNLVAHARETNLDAARALDYATLADGVVRMIREARHRLAPKDLPVRRDAVSPRSGTSP